MLENKKRNILVIGTCCLLGGVATYKSVEKVNKLRPSIVLDIKNNETAKNISEEGTTFIRDRSRDEVGYNKSSKENIKIQKRKDDIPRIIDSRNLRIEGELKRIGVDEVKLSDELKELDKYRWVGSSYLGEVKTALSLELRKGEGAIIIVKLFSLFEFNKRLKEYLYFFDNVSGSEKKFEVGSGFWFFNESSGYFDIDRCPPPKKGGGRIYFERSPDYSFMLADIYCSNIKRGKLEKLLSIKLRSRYR